MLAAIFSGCIVVALIVCWLLAKVTERPLNDVFTALALHGRHFPPFQAGSVHLRDVVYYLMVTYVALFGATRVMEARRWRMTRTHAARQRPLVGALGPRHAGHLRRRAR